MESAIYKASAPIPIRILIKHLFKSAMNPTLSEISHSSQEDKASRISSGLDLSSAQSISTIIYQSSQSKDASSSASSHQNRIESSVEQEDFDEGEDSELDISHEEVAERKIVKIDKKLNKFKAMDKAEKRRLQNRKSALKCRLRKTHTIHTQEKVISALHEEISQLKNSKQSMFEQVRLYYKFQHKY